MVKYWQPLTTAFTPLCSFCRLYPYHSLRLRLLNLHLLACIAALGSLNSTNPFYNPTRPGDKENKWIKMEPNCLELFSLYELSPKLVCLEACSDDLYFDYLFEKTVCNHRLLSGSEVRLPAATRFLKFKINSFCSLGFSWLGFIYHAHALSPNDRMNSCAL